MVLQTYLIFLGRLEPDEFYTCLLSIVDRECAPCFTELFKYLLFVNTCFPVMDSGRGGIPVCVSSVKTIFSKLKAVLDLIDFYSMNLIPY